MRNKEIEKRKGACKMGGNRNKYEREREERLKYAEREMLKKIYLLDKHHTADCSVALPC